MTDLIPRSLFIADVRTAIDLGAMDMGGFGAIYKGECAGQLVALKFLNTVRHQEVSRALSSISYYQDTNSLQSSLQKDFCKEALAWRSVSHRFILPLLGIYQEKSMLFLVSSFMTNGTLTQWRRDQRPDTVEIHRVVRPADRVVVSIIC